MAKKKSAFFVPHLAIRQDEANRLASSDFGETFFKDDGEVNHVNNVTVREDGVAVIHVDGALSYRSSIWEAWFGMDTYNSIEASLDKCLADDSIKGIVFDINSPGGEVSGCADLADKIFKARGSKPAGIVARTGGLMCSAAYWIGSACEKVYTASNGTLGSIGVLCAYSKSSEDVNVIVSDLSPNKAPSPNTNDGLALIKKELNDLAEVFISTVARNRGTSYENVAENFGQGGVFIGAKAVEAGLADAVATLDDICAEMINPETKKEPTMAKDKTAPAAEEKQLTVEEIGANAVAAYKQAIADVKALFDSCAIAEDATAFVDGGKTLADAKEFAFTAMQEKIKAQDENLAAKESEIAQLKADLEAAKTAAPVAMELTAEQKLAIEKGLQAEAAAANSVQGGAQASAESERSRILAAFSQGAAQFNNK